MNDLWSWISDSIDHFRETEDRERFQIAVLYSQGSRAIRDNPDEAVALLEQASRLADQLGERWWMLLCDHWRCQTMLFHTGEIGDALHLATEAVAIADPDPGFAEFPQRVCLHDDQINALQMIDPVGYAPEIEAGCSYIETHGPELEGCQHCKQMMRIDSLIALAKLDRAEASALQALTDCRSETAAHYISEYYAALCRVAAKREDWATLETRARSGELFHGRMGSPQANVEMLMWHALALRHLEERHRATESYKKARSAQRRDGGRQTPGYYDALARYLEADERLSHALIARGIELHTLHGAPYLECLCRLERVRLRIALGASFQDDADAVDATARALRDPEPMLARLRTITGDRSTAEG
jgi:hypothetical protein